MAPGEHRAKDGEPGAADALPVLHRDDDILVVDKPAGLAVHQAPGAGRTLEPLLDLMRFGLVQAPVPAHRLDRDTTGCLVLGRHPEALRRLNRLFAAGAVDKIYWAVVEGLVGAESGVVDRRLLKVRRAGAWSIIADRRGDAARTRWRVLGRGDGRTWLELRPLTGRMHQLRVHCAGMGHPLVADPLYGRPGLPGERLHLHARSVGLADRHGQRIDVLAAAPRQMVPALTACGFAPGDSVAPAG